jgi:hypothetical protein
MELITILDRLHRNDPLAMTHSELDNRPDGNLVSPLFMARLKFIPVTLAVCLVASQLPAVIFPENLPNPYDTSSHIVVTPGQSAFRIISREPVRLRAKSFREQERVTALVLISTASPAVRRSRLLVVPFCSSAVAVHLPARFGRAPPPSL